MAVIALFVLGLLPLRWLGWTSAFADLAQTVFLPVSDPISRTSHYLRPARRGEGISHADADRLLAERDLALLIVEQLRDDNARLRKLNADLQSGLDLNPTLFVRSLAAPVVGRASDPTSPLLTVRAGSHHGVAEWSTVAVVDGVQLVGRVVRVGWATCQVRPITHPASGGLDGVVMVRPDLQLVCRLSPVGENKLRGPVEFAEPAPGEDPPEIEVGMVVRLRDETWPMSARMLEIGRVVSVDRNPAQPLRRIIVVEPRASLDRVSQLVLRIPLAPSEPSQSEDGR